MKLPRLVVAAPSTGQGKTTIATGLMAALRARGLEVSGHKVGPDYIDPGYHAVATGRPGRNLDPHLVGEERVVPLLLHGARGADVAVVEGVMGLHDGRLGTDGFASTAHVARLSRTPVLLVVDVARMSRSVGAVVAGMAAYDPAVTVAGVVLNRAGSARNVAEIERAIDLPVLGVVSRDDSLAAPSRHLGLVPVAERNGAADAVARWGEQVAKHVDLDAVLEVARTAPDLDVVPWDPRAQVRAVDGAPPLVAVAGGRAFTFAYAETVELLQAAGCRVALFDPLHDLALPVGTQALLLGGGFPEVHVAQLAKNTSLLAQVRQAVVAGLPTVAECAGLLYLLDSLDGTELAGVIGTSATMTERLTLRYPVARAAHDNLLSRAGEEVRGHEFHRTALTRAARGWAPAWDLDGELIGVGSPTLHASYLHLHWAGSPRLAERLAEAASAATPVAPPPNASPATSPIVPAPVETRRHDPDPSEPLLHHGDRETGPGLLDFAVNVHPEPRPAWLESALLAGVRDSVSYPDPGVARAAIADLHRRRTDEVLVTAGAAEAFEMVARWKQWNHVVVVHPQFTEPHAALERAGHRVTVVHCRPEHGYRLDPDAVPTDADLVVLGNPTNPTGVLHPAADILRLRRPKRVVVVDEAFMDTVAGESESLAHDRRRGLLVIRSLTKHWSMPGIRVGYVLGNDRSISALAAKQVPWSVSTPAIAAAVACASPAAAAEASRRAAQITAWRHALVAGLEERGIEVQPSQTSFVLARVGHGTRARLRERGIAVRRADTFPGLGSELVRIAVRPPETCARLLDALDSLAALDAPVLAPTDR